MRMGDLTLRFIEPWYELASGELPLEMRVYRAIESRPGVPHGKLRTAVGRKANAVDAMVRELIQRAPSRTARARTATPTTP